jgi:predicted ATPase with chaperone activity
MVARRLTTIRPDLTLPDALDTTRIPRVAGLAGDRAALVTVYPLRSPSYHL